MTFQTEAPLTHRSLHASNRMAREVVNMVRDGLMDVAPVYQRPSVWTDTQRIGLVRSWVTGVPIPAIMINDRATSGWHQANGSSPVDTGEAIYAVVDGRQRVETAVAWFTGALAVPASWFPTEDVTATVDTPDGPYTRYTWLTATAQRFLANRAMLPLIEANVNTVAEEADMFLLVNAAGTAQTDADLTHAAQYATEL